MEADEINEGLAEYMGWRVIGGTLLSIFEESGDA